MNRDSITYIILSAFLFGISTPFAKLLVKEQPPIVLAGLLYLGAFFGLSLYLFKKNKITIKQDEKSPPLENKDIPWLIGAIVSGGILGPIFLMTGLTQISGFAASLLLNLEGTMTVVIAVLFFKENSSKNLWFALISMTIAGTLLSWDTSQNKFNFLGFLLIVIANICWGIDNNLTNQIFDKDAVQIATIKGLVAGTSSLIISQIFGIKIIIDMKILFALILGAFSYGLSLVFFIKALSGLGSSRTGLLFGLSPFIGALFSIIILKESISFNIFPAILFMIFGLWFLKTEKHSHMHIHEPITHTHLHAHNDLHHLHQHSEKIIEPHIHKHTHTKLNHNHKHFPDIHHRHRHNKE